VASSVYGGDGETEVSRLAPSTATEGATNEDEGRSSGEETESNDKAGLRLHFDNSTTDTLGMSMPQPNTMNDLNRPNLNDLYPLLSAIKSRAASVAPMSFPQPQIMPPSMNMGLNSAANGAVNGAVNGHEQWVEEVDSDEDLEAELEMLGDEEVRLHPRFIRDDIKRRRKWEIKFAELIKAVSPHVLIITTRSLIFQFIVPRVGSPYGYPHDSACNSSKAIWSEFTTASVSYRALSIDQTGHELYSTCTRCQTVLPQYFDDSTNLPSRILPIPLATFHVPATVEWW
jgi:hypothetical protein